MKNLVLIRHAKSDWTDVSISDFDRPLNKRGLLDAPDMADAVFCTGVKPGVMLSSPALRAMTTANMFADAFGFKKEKIEFHQEIYNKGAMEIIDLIGKVPSSVNTVFLFGHNPNITFLASYLTSIQFEEVPTCGAVGIAFNIKNWNGIGNKIGKLKFFEYPKKIWALK